jgi:[acyl-carrier-protein] S-malonyltransferase
MNTALGIVFPGQGSQALTMLSDIAAEFSEVETTFNEASQALDYDLWKLTQQGPAELLDQTIHTQPALLAASYALWRILVNQKKVQPALLAGHSLGEYSALVCADAISFKDGIQLVAARGQYMQEAVPAGVSGLAAIVGLDDVTVKNICDKSKAAGEVLSPANFNSPGQVVIAGHLVAVERALVLAKESGARLAKLLPVSVSSHCSLMKPAAERLAAKLQSLTIKKPNIPVVNNVDVCIYASADAIRDGLIRQLYMPVRWVETIQFFEQADIKHIIECGPNKVLTGLNKRISADMRLTTTHDIASLQALLTASSEIL